MPNTDEPHISAWVPFLSKTVGRVGTDTIFLGHSIGCQTILRYLEGLDSEAVVGGAVFVAGWFHLIMESLDGEDEKKIANEWINAPIDIAAVRRHLPRPVALFSDNDPHVPLPDSEIFKDGLGSEVIVHQNRGHFTAAGGVLELHAALNEVMTLAAQEK